MSAPPAGTTFIDDALVSGYVDDMVDGAMRLDDGTLGFRRLASIRRTAQATGRHLRQIGRFFVVLGRQAGADAVLVVALADLPHIAPTHAQPAHRRGRRDRRARASTRSSTCATATLLAEARRIKDSEQAARAQVNAPAGFAHIRTTPQLWAGLRELVFGSLDGSADLSDLGFAPIEGNVPIFGRVSDVLALPGEPWRAPRRSCPPDFPEAVDWYALALDDPREKLEDFVQDAADRRVENEALIASLTAEIESARGEQASPRRPPSWIGIRLRPPPTPTTGLRSTS